MHVANAGPAGPSAYDVSGINIEKLGLQAACQQAYDRGLSDGRCGGCAAGVNMGAMAAMSAFEAASTVERGWFYDDHTVLLFADGSKEHVAWRHEAGTSYDRDKAVMACILKHIVGNSYISALKMLSDEPIRRSRRRAGSDDVPADGLCVADFDDPAPSVVRADEEEDPDRLAPGSDPAVIDAEYLELEEMLANMADEPGFGRGVFLPA